MREILESIGNRIEGILSVKVSEEEAKEEAELFREIADLKEKIADTGPKKAYYGQDMPLSVSAAWEDEKLSEADPSLAPPKRWWNKMVKRVKGANPSYGEEQVRATIGDIWYNKLSDAKRKEIRKREGKTYGAAKIAASASDEREEAIEEAVSEGEITQAMKIVADGKGSDKATLARVPSLVKQIAMSLQVYKDRGEFDGSMESAKECLRDSGYIEDEHNPRFVRIVDLDERGVYRAHIEDEDGDVVWEYDNEEVVVDDEGELTGKVEYGSISMVSDGYMKNIDDMAGLTEYLKQTKIIPSDAEQIYTQKQWARFEDKDEIDFAEAKEYELWIKPHMGDMEVRSKHFNKTTAENEKREIEKEHPDWKVWITTAAARKKDTETLGADEIDDTGYSEGFEEAEGEYRELSRSPDAVSKDWERKLKGRGVKFKTTKPDRRGEVSMMVHKKDFPKAQRIMKGMKGSTTSEETATKYGRIVEEVNTRVAGVLESNSIQEESEDYNFTDKESQKEALADFINNTAKWRYEYQTSNTDAADDYHYAYLAPGETSTIADFLREGPDSYTEDLFEVIDKHKERGVSQDDIIEALYKLAEPREAGIGRETNAITQAPIGEIEDQITGIAGRVNDKQVNDMYAALSDGLTDEDLEEVARNVTEAHWEAGNDYVYISTEGDTWAFVVDPDELDRALTKIKPKKAIKKEDGGKEISRDDIAEYLGQWRDDDSWSDFNLQLDRDFIEMAADYIDGSGALEDDESPEADAIAKMLEKYTQADRDRDSNEFFKNVEVWIRSDTNEHAFIPTKWQHYGVSQSMLKDQHYEFDSGYDEQGKEYKETQLDEAIEEVTDASIRSMSNTIMSQMADIEKREGKMFHEVYPELEDEIVAALDSKNMAMLNAVIKKLDGLSEQTKYEPHCDMTKDCKEPISYVDKRGFAYCEKHGLQRKQSEPCRKLTPKELETIRSGKPIKGY